MTYMLEHHKQAGQYKWSADDEEKEIKHRRLFTGKNYEKTKMVVGVVSPGVFKYPAHLRGICDMLV